MREIIFRGKSIYTKEWMYGNLMYSGVPICVLRFKDISTMNYPMYHQFDVSADTVGQFTGLYDKNGTRIYEGDILKWGKDNKLYVVKFWKGMFYASIEECNKDIIGGFPLYVLTDDDEGVCEIVGNIYDNPELLKSRL